MSLFLYALKNKLNELGFDVIKKRMYKGGDMVIEMQQYICSCKVNVKGVFSFALHFGLLVVQKRTSTVVRSSSQWVCFTVSITRDNVENWGKMMELYFISRIVIFPLDSFPNNMLESSCRREHNNLIETVQ
jgi:hypothetical protein